MKITSVFVSTYVEGGGGGVRGGNSVQIITELNCSSEPNWKYIACRLLWSLRGFLWVTRRWRRHRARLPCGHTRLTSFFSPMKSTPVRQKHLFSGASSLWRVPTTSALVLSESSVLTHDVRLKSLLRRSRLLWMINGSFSPAQTPECRWTSAHFGYTHE